MQQNQSTNPFMRNSSSFTMTNQPYQTFLPAMLISGSPQLRNPLNQTDSKNNLFSVNSAANLMKPGQASYNAAVGNLCGFGSAHSFGSMGRQQQLVRPSDDSLYYEQKPPQLFDDEKLDVNDLESKSSSSSEGYHFEINEARKKSKRIQNGSQLPLQNVPNVPNVGISKTTNNMVQSKESEMKALGTLLETNKR